MSLTTVIAALSELPIKKAIIVGVISSTVGLIWVSPDLLITAIDYATKRSNTLVLDSDTENIPTENKEAIRKVTTNAVKHSTLPIKSVLIYRFVPGEDSYLYQGRLLAYSWDKIIEQPDNEMRKNNLTWIPINSITLEGDHLLKGEAVTLNLSELLHTLDNPDSVLYDDVLSDINIYRLYDSGVRYVVSVPAVIGGRVVGNVSAHYLKTPASADQKSEMLLFTQSIAVRVRRELRK